MTRWRDKTWLITGASTGFGYAASRTIAQRGGRESQQRAIRKGSANGGGFWMS